MDAPDTFKGEGIREEYRNGQGIYRNYPNILRCIDQKEQQTLCND